MTTLMISVKTVQAQGPSQTWQKQFGGNANETVRAWVPTSDGGSLIGGTSESGVSDNKSSGGYGGQDYWIVKLDAAGNKVTSWDKTFGGSGNDALKTILKTTDGGYLLAGSSTSGVSGNKTATGHGGQDYWLIKLNSDGSKAWDQAFGGTANDILADVVQNSDGSYIVGGTSLSGADGNKATAAKGLEDYWVIKITSAGAKVSGWDFTYGGHANTSLRRGYDYLTGIEKTSDGGYLLAGHSNGFGNGSDKSSNPYDDGNNPYINNSDFWVLKINGAGTKVWDQVYGGHNIEKLYDIQPAESADQFLLVGSSRSGNTGNKTSSPANLNSDVAEHVWALKINASGTNNGAIVWSRTCQGRPEVRNYFDNIAAAIHANGYYLFLNARDKDGITKRLDKYDWAGNKEWSKFLADTTHYKSDRKLYQVLSTSFNASHLAPQAQTLYTAFLNGWNTQVVPVNTGYFSAAYPNTNGNGKIDLYRIRGPKGYQNAIKQYIEEGIQDPKLIDIVYDLVEDVYTRFETSNAFWPAGVPLPGASEVVDGVNRVKDKYASDYKNGTGVYGAMPTSHAEYNKSAKARRAAWGYGSVGDVGWGVTNVTTEMRKSPKYKNEPTANTRRRLLYLNEFADNTSIPSYGTPNHPLDLQLSSDYLFWAGYIWT